MASAAVGAAVSAGVEIACQLVSDGKVTSWEAVGISAATGAITSLVPGGTIAQKVFSMGVNAVSDIACDHVKGNISNATYGAAGISAGLTSISFLKPVKKFLEIGKNTEKSISSFGKWLSKTKPAIKYKNSKRFNKVCLEINRKTKSKRGSMTQSALNSLFGAKIRILYSFLTR